jgi:hypothetical protein
MKFGLEILLTSEDKAIPLAELQKSLELAKTVCANPEKIEGAIIPMVASKPAMEPYSDPLLPLLEQWLLKLPWLLAGDTETIPLRNQERTFGFETVSEVVDISCYLGTQNEVEEYILEPVQVPLEQLCESTIGAAKQLLRVLDQVDATFADRAADVRTLKEACVEAERALKNFRLQR